MLRTATTFPGSSDGPFPLDALAERLLARLPTHPDHLAESVRFDAEWWLEHEDEAHRRYETWLARAR